MNLNLIFLYGSQEDNMPECKIDNSQYLVECDDLSKYKEYEDKLFDIYRKIYEEGQLKYHDIEVRMKHYPPDYGVKTGFYHMICENYNHTGNEDDRKPNFHRCKRIKWAKQFIEWCSQNCDKIWIWENERHNKKNILIYCPEKEYLAVLAKRNGYYLLTTAYVVEYANARKDLEKEYNAYKTNDASH